MATPDEATYSEIMGVVDELETGPADRDRRIELSASLILVIAEMLEFPAVPPKKRKRLAGELRNIVSVLRDEWPARGEGT